MKRIAVVSVITLIVAFACGTVPASAKGPEGVDLAMLDGWNIVIPEDAIATEVYGAEEFQKLFAQASGVKLPIVQKIHRPDRHVFIGSSKPMQKSQVGFRVDGLGPEDLRIKVRGKNIAIAGGRPRGTLYGVYTFVEDYLGIRFLTPDHTHVPPLSDWPMAAPVDRIYRPPFVNYRNSGYTVSLKYPVFVIRHRKNCREGDDPRFGRRAPFFSPFDNVGSSLYQQIPFEKYAKEHPEYYALWDGKRANRSFYTYYCLTNPDLLPIVTKAVLKLIEHPNSAGRLNFCVSQNDNRWQYCQCKKCSAIDKREESHMGALLEFANKVADEVGKTHPDVFIGTWAYGFSRTPPKKIKPRDNVQINLNSMLACQLHALDDRNCPANVQYMRELEGWSKICKHLYAWTNNGDFYDPLVPFPNLWTIKPKVNTLVDAGVEGVFMQSLDARPPATEMSDLRHYLISRLLWNPELVDREVIDEFITLHYEKAAPPIRRFINLAQKRYYRDYRLHYAPAACKKSYLPVDKSLARAGLEAFTKAIALAENEAVKARVEKASICVYRAAIDPVWKLKEGTTVDPVLAKRMRPLVKEFFRLCGKYGLAGHVAGHRQRIEGILGNH